MSAVIGALRVVIGADTGSFEDGMKKASSDLKAFASNATTIAAGIQLQKIFEKAGEAIGDMVKAVFKSIDAMDHLGKEAQKIGIPVEQLSALNLAASLSDVSLESLSKSMAKLTKGMVDSDKETSGVARALKALGISASAFKDIAPEKQLEVLAGKFAETEDGATKVAIAMALFGDRVGRQMIPLLNSGSKGLQQVREEAEKLNLIIGTHTAKQAENFNDNLKRLQAATQGWFNVLASFLLPKLEELSNWFVKLTLDANGFRSSAEGLGRTILFLWDNAGKLYSILGTIGKLLSPVAGAFDTLGKAAGFLASKIAEGADPKLKDQYVKLLQDLGFNTKAVTESVDDLTGKTKQLDEELKKKRQLMSEEEAQKAKKFSEKLFDLRVQARELSGDFSLLPPGFIQVAAGLDIVKKNAETLPVTFGALSKSGQQLAFDMLALKAAQITQENLLPLDAYMQKMAELQLVYRTTTMDAETFARASLKIAENFGLGWQQIGTSIAGTAGALSNLTGTFAKENKAMGIASKAFGIGQAIINTQIAVTKALATLPPPASYAAVALAVAQGAASIAAISAQSFAKGGSFIVPGGVSGVDNVMMPMGLASGERVTVETPAQQRRGNVNVHVAGRSFGFDDIRGMIEAINEGLADGHRINLVRA